MKKPNHLLEHDVNEQLGEDPLLNATRIVVKADDGKVTLSGVVDLYGDIDEAVRDAWVVSGAKEVVSELMVGPAGAEVEDAETAAECGKALDDDHIVPRGSVSVTVLDGCVTLIGEVRHHFQSQAAVHAVGRIPGVLGVQNHILLTDEPIPSDVSARISRAFKRDAIIDSSRIQVSNVGQTIYLDGTAGSWTAMNEAVDTAWSAPGVQEVINRLRLEF